MENGIKLNLKKSTIDNNLTKIEFSFDCQNGNISINDETDKADSSDCCLVSRNNDTENIKSSETSLLQQTLYFDKADLSDYILHFENPVNIQLNSSYFTDININEMTADQVKIFLPLENYFEINGVSVKNEYDKYSDKCVDISFSVSENVSFEIQVEKSEISAGAPVGELKETEENKYVYSTPSTIKSKK